MPLLTLDELYANLDVLFEEADYRASLWSGRDKMSEEQRKESPLYGWAKLLYQYHVENLVNADQIALYEDGTVHEECGLEVAVYQTYAFWRGLLDHDFFDRIVTEGDDRFSLFVVSCLTRFTVDFPWRAPTLFETSGEHRDRRFPNVLIEDVELAILTNTQADPTIRRKIKEIEADAPFIPDLNRIQFTTPQYKYNKSVNFYEKSDFFSSEGNKGNCFFASFDSAVSVLLRSSIYKPCAFVGDVEYVDGEGNTKTISLPNYSDKSYSKALINAAINRRWGESYIAENCHLSIVAVNQMKKGTVRLSLELAFRLDKLFHREFFSTKEYTPFETSLKLIEAK